MLELTFFNCLLETYRSIIYPKISQIGQRKMVIFGLHILDYFASGIVEDLSFYQYLERICGF